MTLPAVARGHATRGRRRLAGALTGRAPDRRGVAPLLTLVVAGVALAPVAARAADPLAPEAWSVLLWSVARVVRLLLNLPDDNECPC